MKQPANSCEARKGCEVFGTEGRGEEEERGRKLKCRREVRKRRAGAAEELDLDPKCDRKIDTKSNLERICSWM